MASLLDDLLRTAGATTLTAGAYGLKGLTLGLLDPTQEVAELLGKEVAEAPPRWALTGAEIAGSIGPVSGALGLARKAIPGVGAIPRVLQGFTAGAGLGAVGGAIEGLPAEDILKGSLLEGAVFGGLEGLAMIPGMVKKRKLRDVQKLWSGVRTGTMADWATTSVEDVATKAAGESIVEPSVAAQLSKLGAETAKLPEGVMLSQDFVKDPNLLMYFKLMDEPMTVQTLDRLVTGQLHTWDKKKLTIEVAPGLFEHFDFKDFAVKKGVQKLRMFRGGVESHKFPRNRPLELKTARGETRKMYNYLYATGRMAKSDMNKIQRFINPRAKHLRDLSEHELHTYSSYLQKLTKGEKITDPIMEQVKIYGPAEADVRVGIGARLRPARWAFETLNHKLPWMMDRFFHPSVKAVGDRGFHQLSLMDNVRTLAEGLTRKDLKRIYEIDKYLAKNIKTAAGTPQYQNIRTGMMDMQYRQLEKAVGPAKAAKLRTAHDGFRAMFDDMFDQLTKAGILPKKRYIKEYWPLLRDQSVISAMFSGKGGQSLAPNLPRKVKGFMEHVRKGVIDNPETDILKLSQAYISVYTKLLHLRPVVDDMYKLFKDFRVKRDVRDFMKHYMSRQLGMISEMDYRMASTLKDGLKYIPGVGDRLSAGFAARDWQRMGQFFNNMPYYAHMGMRPFAAARNLMQPFITTGPMIGNRWLVRGIQLMTKPKSWEYIKSIGGLQESLGEYTRRLHIRPRMRDKFANGLMYMFRKSDEMNRITAGMGMAAKFDHHFAKMGMTEEFFTKIKLRRFRQSVRSRVRDKSKVFRALKELETHKYPEGSKAYKVERKIIDEFSHGEKYATSAAVERDIKDTLVKEAIGDTQWLYGKDQSPLFGWSGGFLGRQAMTYQTWWLNYLEWGKNLLRTTKGGDYAPLATAFANNILLMFALTGVVGWSWDKAQRTIAFGPFSGRTFLEGEVPPGIDPVVKSLGSIRNVITGDFEGAEQRLETAMKKAWDNWVPMSLVYKELAKVGVTPRINDPIFGARLTPKAKKKYAEPYEKVLSVFGRQ
jgi:hypothetical protein